MELKYVRLWQDERKTTLRPLALGVASLPNWPWPPYDVIFKYAESKGQQIGQRGIIPIRKFQGPLDMIKMYNAPPVLRPVVLVWSQAGLPYPMTAFPGLENRILTVSTLGQPVQSNWRPLLPPEVIQRVRDRYQIDRQTEGPQGTQRPATPIR
jgi:hypothetical protein